MSSLSDKYLNVLSATEQEIDIDEYNILMLGTSGVGKTVFMTMMLYELILANAGINIETEDALKQMIIEDYQKICNGEILPGTARQNEWKFVVNYNDEKLFDFNWIDYRGGAIDYKEMVDINGLTDESEELIHQLERSMAIFVIADGERFVREEQEVLRELKKIREIIDVSLSVEERPLNVVLLLAKSDAIALKRGLFGKKWKKEKLAEYCNRVFGSSFKDFTKTWENSLCHCIPISSYGNSAKLNKTGQIEVKVKPGQRIESFQIHAPLAKAFSFILSAIKLEIPIIKEEIEDEKKLLREGRNEAANKHFKESVNLINYFTRARREKLNSLKTRKLTFEQRLEFKQKEMLALEKRGVNVKKSLKVLDKQKFFEMPNFE